MSFAAVAANPSARTADGTVEATFKKAIAGLPAARRENIARRAKVLVEAPDAQREFLFGPAGTRSPKAHLDAGGFSSFASAVTMPALDAKLLGVPRTTLTVPVSELRAVPDGLLIPGVKAVPEVRPSAATPDATVGARAMESDRVADVWGEHYADDPLAGGPAAGELQQFATPDKIGLWIERIKCVDETNPEWWGSDEIALGGVKVDNKGTSTIIAEKYISDGFDDGDSIAYGNWRWAGFSLTGGQYWPKHYSVTFVPAERDNGGLSAALNEIWSNVKEEVKKAIEKAVAGALSGYVGEAIATAIGKAVAWISGALIGWIIALWKDDLFPMFTASVNVPGMGASWKWPNGTWGNPSSGTRHAHFYGHGGHYRIDYRWQFYT